MAWGGNGNAAGGDYNRLLLEIPFDLPTACQGGRRGSPLSNRAVAQPGSATLLMSLGSSGEFWKTAGTGPGSVLEHLVPDPRRALASMVPSTDF